MEKTLICSLIQDYPIKARTCSKDCIHRVAHTRNSDCAESECDNCNIVCKCVPISRDWDN